LGRQVTHSPTEVPKAFAAPPLQAARSNADMNADMNALLQTPSLPRLRHRVVRNDIQVDLDCEATSHSARTESSHFLTQPPFPHLLQH
ncbi:hypothetical protein BDU57DRAFT_462284, partial [Ampelomyces quisqualis]